MVSVFVNVIISVSYRPADAPVHAALSIDFMDSDRLFAEIPRQ